MPDTEYCYLFLLFETYSPVLYLQKHQLYEEFEKVSDPFKVVRSRLTAIPKTKRYDHMIVNM